MASPKTEKDETRKVSKSTSVSFVVTLPFNVTPAPIVWVSLVATGKSFTAVTEIVRVAVEVRLPLSLSV